MALTNKKTGYVYSGPGYEEDVANGVEPLTTDTELNTSDSSGMRKVDYSNYNYGANLEDYVDAYSEDYFRPDDYSSKYTGQIDNILNTILNRQAFDINTDANYQQLYNTYKESYQNQARKGMNDAMGAAQSATGGYGNSYAAAVGQQTYDDYMSQLNDNNMNLMQLAYGMYQDDIADNYNQLNAVNTQDNIDYSRYRDTMSDYFTDRDYYTNLATSEYSADYANYRDSQSAYNTDRDYNYNVNNDAYQMAVSFAESGITVPERYAQYLDEGTISQLNTLAAQAAANRYKTGSGSGSGGSKKSDGYSNAYSTAKGLDNFLQAKSYLENMANDGYISDEEAYDIYNTLWASKIPRTYEAYYAATDGEDNIMTEREFSRGYKESKRYDDYEDYLEQKYGAYVRREKK